MSGRGGSPTRLRIVVGAVLNTASRGGAELDRPRHSLLRECFVEHHRQTHAGLIEPLANDAIERDQSKNVPHPYNVF